MPKPETPFAKADAEITREFKEIHPGHATDVIEFGIRVADYNAGFHEGDRNGRHEMANLCLSLIDGLASRVTGKWPAQQRKEYDSLVKLLKLEKKSCRGGKKQR